MSLRSVHFFCGFGGDSEGFREAGFEVVWAANHWDKAIDTHSANFRNADHFLGDISGYDMRRVPRADVAWLSPECTWHSPAGGRKRVRAQLDMFDDYVPNAAGERSRATMWDVVRAAEAKQFKIVVVENVVEVTSWPLFENWLTSMVTLGYDYQILCVSAAHIGSPTNAYAPQWRDRIYFIFYKHGIPMPDVSPRPIAWCPECGEVVRARQAWKRADRRAIGKYGQQYVYVCPSDRHRATVVEPFVMPAASAIDWSDLGTRIGDRAKPLAAATMRRIEAGLRLFGEPTMVTSQGNTWDSMTAGHPHFNDPNGYLRAWPTSSSPMMARTGTPGDGLAIPPFMTSVNHGGDDARAYDPQSRPFPTRSTKIGDGIVMPFISHHYGAKLGDERRNQAITDPLGTIVASGAHHSLVTPPGAFIQKHHGGLDYAAIGHMVKSVHEPLPSMVARANTSLVIPFRRNARATRAAAEPLSTMTAGGNHHGILDTAINVEDCHFRMLGPREHLRAQRFPDEYIVKGNKSEQTKGAGNAVASNVANYIGGLAMIALSSRRKAGSAA